VYQKPLPFRPGGGFFNPRQKTGMLAGEARPETKLLPAIVLTIVGALAVGLPMTLLIIWACS
jgi:hypothetical protein